MKLGIIGSAGRGTDQTQITPAHYDQMIDLVKQTCQDLNPQWVELHSGGAAWMDHCAVGLWKDSTFMFQAKGLVLHFPCRWDLPNQQYCQTTIKGDPGSVANYWHQRFSLTMTNGESVSRTLGSIHQAILDGCSYDVSEGFMARNKLVGEVDYLIAATFGTKPGRHSYKYLDPQYNDARLAGLKQGGTSHTWNNSKAQVKIHLCLS